MADTQPSPVALRLQAIKNQLAEHSRQNPQQLPEPLLVAVSKGQSVDQIKTALTAGQYHFGENYWQEAQEKIAAFASHDLSQKICWHFIGRIQSNKAARIGAQCHWVHGVDRPALLELLVKKRPAHMPPLNLCLQIRLNTQPSNRNGLSPDQIAGTADRITHPQLRLRGLMFMASPNPQLAQEEFQQIQQLFAHLHRKYPDTDTLCMGTSSDWQLALQNGSNMLRIGQAVFGPRSYPTRPN
ncbi:MAG: YggS family pyridoxal phosphate-dependent enzyme [Gammaproteobacteria bacterium]